MRIAYVAVAVVILMTGLLYVSFNPFPGPNSTSTLPGVTCHSFGTNFVILANGLGFNDSVDHDVPKTYWPVMCVHMGDTVRITVENTGGSEPHGFAIAHYYAQGVSIPAGSNVTVTFAADTAGTFKVYCNILCSVHAFMLNGLFVVE